MLWNRSKQFVVDYRFNQKTQSEVFMTITQCQNFQAARLNSMEVKIDLPVIVYLLSSQPQE